MALSRKHCTVHLFCNCEKGQCNCKKGQIWQAGRTLGTTAINHPCEELLSKCTKEQTLFDNCKFVRSIRIIVQLKIKRHVWQPIFDQPV